MGRELDNAAPTIFETQQTDRRALGVWSSEFTAPSYDEEEEEAVQPIDSTEVFGECEGAEQAGLESPCARCLKRPF